MTMRSPDDAAPAGEAPASRLAVLDEAVALPDEQSLIRLANAMFAALPGAEVTTKTAGMTAGPAFEPHFSSPGALPTAPAFYAGAAQHPVLSQRPVEAKPPATIPLPGGAELQAILASLSPQPGSGIPAGPPSGSPLYFLTDMPRTSRSGQFPGAHSLGTPQQAASPAHGGFDVNAARRDFPILSETANGRPLIWLDNAATTQKPKAVIDRLARFYQHENSNIHRAAHELAARATDAYEGARETIRRFLNAASSDEIVFVRGATEAINLVAESWGRKNIGRDDQIVITWLEHHANIVPWQQLCTTTGARLRVVPVDDRGEVRLDAYESLLGPATKLVAFTHVSNALGTITPARQMVEMARRYDARVLIDGAQAVSHMPVDVQALGCDWYVFSGHKIFAPTGIGALFGKSAVLEAMPPWQGGGNMIREVTFEQTTFHSPPGRFEAGTGNIADAVGLAAAIDYLERIGMANVGRYEQELLAHATRLLSGIPGLRLIGTAAEKAAVISFVFDGITSEDVGAALNREGIAVRAGHHCAQPILRRFGLESTVRPSLAFYNTFAEIDALAAALLRIKSGSPHLG